MPTTRVGESEEAAGGHEARLRAAGRCRVHDDVRRRHLIEQLDHRLHVAERAERRRRADRDLERRPARRAQRRRDLAHPGGPLLAPADVHDVSAEQRVEQRVGGRGLLRRAVRDEDRAQSHLRRGRGGRTRVIRLDAAGRDQRVGALVARARRDERELADLVPAEPERDRIVALDEEARAAADHRGKARHRFDRRRLRREWDRRTRARARRGGRPVSPARIV